MRELLITAADGWRRYLARLRKTFIPFLRWFVLTVVVVGIVVVPTVAHAGVFSTVDDAFAIGLAKIGLTGQSGAQTIFNSLVLLEFLFVLYDLIKHRDSVSGMNVLLDFVILVMVNLYLIHHSIDIAADVKNRIGTFATSFSGGGAQSLDADGIATLGNKTTQAMWSAQPTDIWTSTAIAPFQILAALGLGWGFLLAAVDDEAITIGTQFAVQLGIICLGFLIFRHTRSWAAIYPRMCFLMFLALIAVHAVVGVGTDVAGYDMGMVNEMNDSGINGIKANLTSIGIASMAYGLFAMAIPSLVLWLGSSSPIAGSQSVRNAVTYMMASWGARAGASAGSGAAAESKEAVGSLQAATSLE